MERIYSISERTLKSKYFWIGSNVKIADIKYEIRFQKLRIKKEKRKSKDSLKEEKITKERIDIMKEKQPKIFKENKRNNASSVSNYHNSIINTSRSKYSYNNRV